MLLDVSTKFENRRVSTHDYALLKKLGLQEKALANIVDKTVLEQLI